MKAIGTLAAAVLALGGCLGAGEPPPVDRFHRISIGAPATLDRPSLPGTVLVARLDAEGPMRERPLVYSADPDGTTLAQHEYDYWVEPPARLLQAALVRYLRSSGVAPSVVTPDLRLPSEYEVIGTIRRFERLIGRSRSRVAVTLDLALVDRFGDRPPIVKTYAAEIACPDDTVGGSVSAFNEAISTIFAEFLDDIRLTAATA